MSERAVIYLRVSKAHDGETSSESQEFECRELAEENGWDVVGVFSDLGVSGFKNVGRAQFDAMLDVIRTGGAEKVVVYSVDRFTRKGIIEGIKIVAEIQDAGAALVSVGEDIDTSTAAGESALARWLEGARHESDRKSKRSKSWHAKRKKAGAIPPGPRPFGYDRVDGTLVVREAEAELIRSARDQVVDGASLRSIVRAWNADGITTANGKPWSSRGLSQVLTGPTVAGLVRLTETTTGPGIWPGILTEDEWAEVVKVLEDPLRRTSGRNGLQYPLVGLATCAVDGTKLISKPHTATGTRYVCPTCSVSAPAEKVDAVIVAALGAAFDSDVWADATTDTGPVFDEAALKAEKDQLAAMYADDLIDLDQFRTMADALAVKLETAQAQTESANLPDLAEVIDRWDEMPAKARRAILMQVVEAVTLAPASPGNRFDPTRV